MDSQANCLNRRLRRLRRPAFAGRQVPLMDMKSELTALLNCRFLEPKPKIYLRNQWNQRNQRFRHHSTPTGYGGIPPVPNTYL